MKTAVFLSFVLLYSTAVQGEEESAMQTVYDFSTTELSGRWRSVNDSVMGGVSRGGFRVLSQLKRLEFTGDLSLENRGGFASIRSTEKTHDLSDTDGVALRVRGDGRRYSINLHTNQTRWGGSYRMELPTKKGEWVVVRAPFAKFKSTFHGRVIPGARAVNRAQIRAIGVTLSDKREGRFKLEIDWIKAYAEASDPVQTDSERGRARRDKESSEVPKPEKRKTIRPRKPMEGLKDA